MAEYLAPGVYVEEVDNGAKPIEGVSTSTAGMVGMAERGPTDVPILVTSIGEYDRWFGGILNRADFADGAGTVHCYLPHAVEGFFSNGGKRLYVVRVAPPQAARANASMFWRDPSVANVGETVLLRGAGQGTGTVIPLLVLSSANLVGGERLRIGDGSASEYLTVNVVTSPVTQHIPLGARVTRSHAAAGAISEHVGVAPAGTAGAKALVAAVPAGATELIVSSPVDLVAASIAAAPNGLPWLAQMVVGGTTDIPVVTAVQAVGPDFRLTLNQPIQQAYGAGQNVDLFRSQATGARVLETDATPGDMMIFATTNGAGAAIVELDRGLPTHEAFLRGALGTISFAQALPFAIASGARIEQVTLADAPAPVTDKLTTAIAARGTQTLSLANREGLAVGQVVRIGVAALEEYATIVSIPGERGPAPDAGTITLSQPVSRDYAVGTVVRAQGAPVIPAAPNAAGRVVLAAAAGAAQLLVTDTSGWAALEFARITNTDGAIAYARVTATTAATPATISLTTNLARSHQAGEPAVERHMLFDVEALDTGSWGNRLSISAENETRPLAETRVLVLTPPLQFTVESLTGIEAGSLIELRNPVGGATARLKVRAIDRASGAVTLDAAGLTPAVLAGLGAIVDPLEVRSIEFRLTVNLRRRPDPAVPSRNTLILASETFAGLSMDHRHSRYFQRVIGATNGALRLEDNRPEGESAFIRVLDSLQDAATEVIRTGPEALIDLLPGGLVQPARHRLASGDDSLATMHDGVYLGADNVEPRLRTGLAALRNLPEISLVSIPGQTSAALQGALIVHCEQARYRFAILDARNEDSSIADVRNQRQQFDTKYAALYYPWLTIPDPIPTNLANVSPFALPPSGHVTGLIARVDNERGVHKAPANEVVRGITGLTRTLQKGEHDILNPGPVNINVIRDFRPDGRSIRLFGARCITSDQAHKYVNVRRLLIFLEQSIERGLQWVVFEPNAEPLWARVTQTISNFLTDVWRAGALEGTEPGQGFFVKCDSTTMTQSDIDNGRLICVIGVAPVKPAEFVKIGRAHV